MRTIMDVDKALPGRVRALRQYWGWSQGDLADKAGLSRGVVSTLERGVGEPRARTLEAVARALRVDVNDLYGRPRRTPAEKFVDHLNELRANPPPLESQAAPAEAMIRAKRFVELLRQQGANPPPLESQADPRSTIAEKVAWLRAWCAAVADIKELAGVRAAILAHVRQEEVTP